VAADGRQPDRRPADTVIVLSTSEADVVAQPSAVPVQQTPRRE